MKKTSDWKMNLFMIAVFIRIRTAQIIYCFTMQKQFINLIKYTYYIMKWIILDYGQSLYLFCFVCFLEGLTVICPPYTHNQNRIKLKFHTFPGNDTLLTFILTSSPNTIYPLHHDETRKNIILVFNQYVTNYHKLNGIKRHSFISPQFCRSEVQLGIGTFTAQRIRVLESRPHLVEFFFLNDQGKNLLPCSFRLLAKFISCSFMTEDPIFLLTVIQFQLSTHRGTLHSLSCAPLHLQIQQQTITHVQNPSDFQIQMERTRVIKLDPPRLYPF